MGLFNLISSKKSLSNASIVGSYTNKTTGQPKIDKTTGKPKPKMRFLRSVKNNHFNPTNKCEIVNINGKQQPYYVNGVETKNVVKCLNYEGTDFNKMYSQVYESTGGKKKSTSTKKRVTKKKSTTTKKKRVTKGGKKRVTKKRTTSTKKRVTKKKSTTRK